MVYCLIRFGIIQNIRTFDNKGLNESARVLETPIQLGAYSDIPVDNSVTWMPEPLSYVLLDRGKNELTQWRLPED